MPTEVQLDADLKLLSGKTNAVRTYSTLDTVRRRDPEARHGHDQRHGRRVIDNCRGRNQTGDRERDPAGAREQERGPRDDRQRGHAAQTTPPELFYDPDRACEQIG